jgi:uncharacterized membrane-anchored protein
MDFLRGDYVELSYFISGIPDSLRPSLEGTQNGDYTSRRNQELEVYVSLKVDKDGVGTVKDATFQRPAGGLYLRGHGARWDSRNISYGLEAYFVSEGTGWELERAVRDHRVLADVRVLRGRGVINTLVIGDEIADDLADDSETE